MDELAIIEELDSEQRQWDQTFVVALLVMNDRLLESLYGLIDRLAFRGQATTRAEVLANMGSVTGYRATLMDTLLAAGFNSALTTLLANMGMGADRLNSYFTAMVPDFDADLYSSSLSGLALQTRQVMLSTLSSVYQQAIGDTLTWGVLSKATGSEMRALLREKLTKDGLAVRQVGQVASDALYGFSRGYSQMVAEGLNLKHYYYMGTEVSQTRPFCRQRFGRVYTNVEVEDWVNQDWSGKIPGTTKVSIYWYCGGYRCRHRLLPISRTLYNQLKQQQNG